MEAVEPAAARPRLFVVVRVPKSGSTSLNLMVRKAMPDVRIFYLPKLLDPDAELTRMEQARAAKSRIRRYWRIAGALTEKGVWRRIASLARDGDVVSGHFPFGRPDLPGFDLSYVTLVRNPLDRLVSEYNYTRAGMEDRSGLRKLYQSRRTRAALRWSFGDYLRFLDEHKELYANLATRYVTGRDRCADPIAFLDASYFHYGALERLDLFAIGLSARIGRPVATEHERITRAKAPVALAAADRAIFERLFEGDILMHQRVLETVASERRQER